ncbi:nucleoside hydrolase [Corynebacterium sp. H78]|uniref:nucleoside hydrolase n=1 Tax=Corynebacterium sp. H78 TaxID=3133417 RepID=UPI00309FD4A2
MSNSRAPRILADVDTGIDDALALIYLAALHSAGEIELIGVTCSAGNTDAAQATHNSRWILNLCGAQDVPVASAFPAPYGVHLTTTPETHGPSGLGYNDAPPVVHYESVNDPLALWSQPRARGARLVVTGPLTIFERAISERPECVRAFESVTVMGGAVGYPGNTTPYSEWNFWVDPHATSTVFSDEFAIERRRQQFPSLTLCPLNITETITVSDHDISLWHEAGMSPELHRAVNLALKFYFEFHQSVGVGYLAQIHDLFAVMVAVGSVDHDTERIALCAADQDTWHTDPDRRGHIYEDRRGLPVDVVTHADRDSVMAEFVRAISLTSEDNDGRAS